MMSLFKDRREAGRRLAFELQQFREADVLVLALPRGGVPVGYEVACALGAPLDVFVVRKLPAPGNAQSAMGALASGGLIVLNDDVVRERNIDAAGIADVARQETHELVRREQKYRSGRPPSNVADMTVLLVDDGAATGATMRAASRALRKGTPHHIVVAVPVAAAEARAAIAEDADEVVCIDTPQPFTSIEAAYHDFRDVSDDEMRALLAAAWSSERERTAEPVDLRGELTSSNRR